VLITPNHPISLHYSAITAKPSIITTVYLQANPKTTKQLLPVPSSSPSIQITKSLITQFNPQAKSQFIKPLHKQSRPQIHTVGFPIEFPLR
jgi:hypothetical protein